jgi:hypothetical protein
MDKLVARLLAGAALWVRIPDIYQKYKMGDKSKHTQTRQKNKK